MLDASPSVSGARVKPWRAIVARATAARPEQRYDDPRALLEDVRRLEAGEPIDAYRESWPERFGRVVRRHSTLTMLVLVYLVVRALLLAVARKP
jgi:hypothetical protein